MMRLGYIAAAALLAPSCASHELSLGRIQVRSATTPGVAAGEDAYLAAKRQLALGNLGLAVDGFRKAIRENSASPDAFNGLAVAYDRMGRFDLSRQAFEEALALAPSDQAIMHNLERSLIAQGRHAEAAQLAREAGDVPAAKPDVTVEIAMAEPAAPVPKSEGRMRVERISTREVALITGGRRNGWEAVADVRPSAARQTATMRDSRPLAVSRQGALELALPPANAAAGPRLIVLNAVGQRGLARQMSGFLREKGWEKTSIGDARTHRKSSFVIHAPGDRLTALLLARVLPFESRLVASANARSMVLLLGSNAVASPERSRVAVKS